MLGLTRLKNSTVVSDKRIDIFKLRRAVMLNIEKNLDSLSDDQLRELLLEEKRVQALSREGLLAELKASKSTTLADMEIHPLSSLAIASASPGQAQIKAIKSVLPWEWAAMIIIAIVIFTVASAVAN